MTGVDAFTRTDAYLRGLHPRSLAFWTVCIPPALFVAVVTGFRLPLMSLVARGGVRTDAVVVGTPCAGGTRRFTYRFDADGRTLQGVGRVGELGVDCSALAAGGVVPVFYLPAEPASNEATDAPGRTLRRQLTLMAAFSAATMLGVAGVLLAFRRG